MAPSNPTIADTPAELTPQWFTQVLRAGGHLDDVVVTEAVLRPLGTGQMSDAFGVSLRYDRPNDAPERLIAKLPSADATSRTTATVLRSYEKEVRFYQELAPALPVRTPAVYHAAIDPRTAGFVLLLEDLAPASQGDQLAGCSVEVAAAALAQLVPLHAPRWGDGSLAEIEWLAGDPEASRVVGLMLLPNLWEGFQERYGSVLAPHVVRAGRTLFDRLDAYLTPAAGPQTVVHGDYRLDNLLLVDAAVPEVAGIVDWQTCGLGPASADVAYFVGAGLHEDERRRHEADLVKGYHQSLLDAGVIGYPWDDCWSDYRRGTWAGLVMAIGASMMVERTDRGDEMFVAMAERHARHALDLDAIDLLD